MGLPLRSEKQQPPLPSDWFLFIKGLVGPEECLDRKTSAQRKSLLAEIGKRVTV
jgi:hypothetical protein